VVALNLFLQDIYGQQAIIKDKQIPRALVYSCVHFRREMIGVQVPHGIHTHICGIDLVRDSKTGEFIRKTEAEKRPRTTTVESVPKRGHGDTGRGKKKR
jgi:uncharacterized circularly permuted ATP-grasp superfamily protein